MVINSNIIRKILIVEDDVAISQMYKIKLEMSGFMAYIAENGQVGLEIAKKELPSLVLLDLKMPIMNGDEMLEQLRAAKWGGNIRVIVLTNISKDEAPSAIRFLHVDRYIVKAHHTPSQVVEIVKEILD